jgi:hypothetical protein
LSVYPDTPVKPHIEIIDANVAAAHFYGYSLEQLRAKKIIDNSTWPQMKPMKKCRQQ